MTTSVLTQITTTTNPCPDIDIPVEDHDSQQDHDESSYDTDIFDDNIDTADGAPEAGAPDDHNNEPNTDDAAEMQHNTPVHTPPYHLRERIAQKSTFKDVIDLPHSSKSYYPPSNSTAAHQQLHQTHQIHQLDCMTTRHR